MKARVLARGIPLPVVFGVQLRRWWPRAPTLFWICVVVAEVALAALLVRGGRLASFLAASFFLCAAAYARLASHRDRQVPCACFGITTQPASGKAVVRAGLLACATLLAGSRNWHSEAYKPVLLVPVVLLVVLFLILSPDIRAVLRSKVARRAARSCSRTPVSDALVLSYIRESRTWAALAAYLTNPIPSDFWSEGCKRFMTFEARYRSDMATATFLVDPGFLRSSCGGFLRRGTTGDILLSVPTERLPLGGGRLTMLRFVLQPSRARPPARVVESSQTP